LGSAQGRSLGSAGGRSLGSAPGRSLGSALGPFRRALHGGVPWFGTWGRSFVCRRGVPSCATQEVPPGRSFVCHQGGAAEASLRSPPDAVPCARPGPLPSHTTRPVSGFAPQLTVTRPASVVTPARLQPPVIRNLRLPRQPGPTALSESPTPRPQGHPCPVTAETALRTTDSTVAPLPPSHRHCPVTPQCTAS
jgi:hypothetical protein